MIGIFTLSKRYEEALASLLSARQAGNIPGTRNIPENHSSATGNWLITLNLNKKVLFRHNFYMYNPDDSVYIQLIFSPLPVE